MSGLNPDGLGRTGNFGSIDTEEFYNTPKDPTLWDDGSRPIISTQDREIFVDPNNGSDDAEGTEADPVKTLAEAAMRCNHIHSHQYWITLENGTYTGDGRFAPILSSSKPNSETAVKIRSKSGNPSDVTLEGVYSFGVWNGEADKPLIQDVTISGTVLGKFGSFKLSNVTFTGTTALTAGEGPVAIDAHAWTTIALENCTFEDTVALGLQIQENATALLLGCDGVCSEFVANVRRGSTLKEEGVGSLYGETGFIKYELNGQFVNREGLTKGSSVAAADDWGDGELVNRWGPAIGGYRPTWDLQSGSPSAIEGAATFPPGDTTAQVIRTPYRKYRENSGSWRFQFEPQASPTTGDIFTRFYYGEGGEYWGLRLDADGTGDLLKENGGLSTDLITLSWPADTSVVDVEITRENGQDWEVFINGASQGTLVDSFTPRPERIDIQNRLDVAMHCKNFRLEPGN